LAGFVDSTVKDIDDRLRELKEEVTKLEAARAALAGGRRGPGRPRGSAPASPAATTRKRAGRRPGRPRGRRSGTRSAQALELVRSRPGIKIPEIAQELKIEPNYLYRVMPSLEKDGQITRDADKGYRAAASK
jgi:hypothetical protein